MLPPLESALVTAGPREPEPTPSPVFATPWGVAGVALAVGLAIDTLALHQRPGLGLAVGLWIALATAASVGYLRHGGWVPGARATLAAGFTMAALVAVRTSPVLLTLNIGVAIGLGAMLTQMGRHGGLVAWRIMRYGRHALTATGDAIEGAVQFVTIDLRDQFGEAHSKQTRAVAVGLLIGFPLLIVFGGLFASADAIFGGYLEMLTSSAAAESVFWRAAISTSMALAVAGLWRSARTPDPPARPSPRGRTLDMTSGITVLSLLVVLFSFFVLTQVVGHNPELVRNGDYSRNAREGFFQLVTVAFLVLNVLLVFDWMTGRRGGPRSATFDRLAMALIGLTGVVMVSAVNRMRLYVATFGLTELRFYTTVFMGWLAVVLLWFIFTVLRSRHASFALGVAISACVFVVGLNVANPDAFIVEFNWNRHLAGAEFDKYNASLSADSLEALLAIQQEHPEVDGCFVERSLAAFQTELEADWQRHGLLGDSWTSWRSRQALQSLDLELGNGCSGAPSVAP